MAKQPRNYKKGYTHLKLALKTIYFGNFSAFCNLLFSTNLKTALLVEYSGEEWDWEVRDSQASERRLHEGAATDSNGFCSKAHR